MMESNETGSATDEITEIPRSRIFVLIDGSFVVRWSESRVQELETGHYRAFTRRDIGAHITDYELKQLQVAGIVHRFDKETVWLYPLPERIAHHHLTEWERERSRSYYLHTTLPGALLQDVLDLLEDVALVAAFQARLRDDFVVLWGNRGLAFQSFDEAEKARLLLVETAPEAFSNTVVAFVETTRKN